MCVRVCLSVCQCCVDVPAGVCVGVPVAERQPPSFALELENLLSFHSILHLLLFFIFSSSSLLFPKLVFLWFHLQLPLRPPSTASHCSFSLFFLLELLETVVSSLCLLFYSFFSFSVSFLYSPHFPVTFFFLAFCLFALFPSSSFFSSDSFISITLLLSFPSIHPSFPHKPPSLLFLFLLLPLPVSSGISPPLCACACQCVCVLCNLSSV